MAGAGYKLFNTGDVLTAAQVNTYLNEQTVMVFASSAARTSALSGVLAEGMVSYLQDTNAVQVYNGTAWVAVGGSSPLTTKGDLYTFSTVDARLGVGTNGHVLTADSVEATGLKWAAPAAGGGMTLINTGGTALTTATTTVSSIPGTYKYLIVYVTDYYMSTNDQLMRIYFNSDTTAANYGALALRAASGAGDLGWNNDARISQYGIKNAANQNFASITVPDYANATTYKQYVVNGSYQRGSDNIKANDLTIGSWLNTNAITSVSINTAGGTWSDGTMFVYGVN